jgi:aarF domain-containing kinase
MADMSAQMASVRAQMEENEQLSVLMAGLRGSNMNDEDFADQNVVMQLINVSASDGEV